MCQAILGHDYAFDNLQIKIVLQFHCVAVTDSFVSENCIRLKVVPT